MEQERGQAPADEDDSGQPKQPTDNVTDVDEGVMTTMMPPVSSSS